jgi:hypothetical protein
MTPLFTKLNLGTHREILVVAPPRSFESELALLRGVTIRRESDPSAAVPFVLVFVMTLAEVEAAAKWLPALVGDSVVWFAYPKGTSKRYRCEFNRDNGWAAISAAGFESVRMVAIDEDWSALRFRRTEYVKSRGQGSATAVSPTKQRGSSRG